MNSRYASAPAMIPPPTSESWSTISNAASTEPWRRRSASARAANRSAVIRAVSACARTRASNEREAVGRIGCFSSTGATVFLRSGLRC